MLVGPNTMVVFTLVVLAFFWWSANHNVTLKLVASALVLASFGLLLLPREHFYLFFIAQLMLIIAMGVSTFGIDWLNQRVR